MNPECSLGMTGTAAMDIFFIVIRKLERLNVVPMLKLCNSHNIRYQAPLLKAKTLLSLGTKLMGLNQNLLSAKC